MQAAAMTTVTCKSPYSWNPVAEGRIWLNAQYSYQLLISERDELLSMLQIAAKEIDVAVVNKTTISYGRVIGRFSTDGAALVTVSFETEGYAASYAVVQIASGGTATFSCSTRKTSGISSASWENRTALPTTTSSSQRCSTNRLGDARLRAERRD